MNESWEELPPSSLVQCLHNSPLSISHRTHVVVVGTKGGDRVEGGKKIRVIDRGENPIE